MICDKLEFSNEAFEHYNHWANSDKKVFRKIQSLIKEARRTPYTGTGKPEKLVGNLKGYISRRVNREHRLVYKVEGSTLIIISCRYIIDCKQGRKGRL